MDLVSSLLNCVFLRALQPRLPPRHPAPSLEIIGEDNLGAVSLCCGAAELRALCCTSKQLCCSAKRALTLLANELCIAITFEGPPIGSPRIASGQRMHDAWGAILVFADGAAIFHVCGEVYLAWQPHERAASHALHQRTVEELLSAPVRKRLFSTL